jgi:hypothetical protein
MDPVVDSFKYYTYIFTETDIKKENSQIIEVNREPDRIPIGHLTDKRQI